MNKKEIDLVFSKSLLEQYSTYTELAEKVGCKPSLMYEFLKSKGLFPSFKGNYSIATRLRMSNGFMLDKVSLAESYYYGMWLGDGATSATRGIINGTLVYCYNKIDYDHLKLLEEKLGYGKILHSNRKGLILPLYGPAVDRLVENKFIWINKSKIRPQLPQNVFEVFDFFMVLRGYLAADGYVRRRVDGKVSYVSFASVWLEFLEFLKSELLKRGVQSEIKVYERSGTWQNYNKLIIRREGVERLLSLGFVRDFPELQLYRKRLV